MPTSAIYSTMVMLSLLLVSHLIRGEERRVRHQRSGGTNMQLDREFQANFNQVFNGWRCNSPRPQLVYLNEAIDEPVIPPDERLIFKATVMHRCDSCLGWCNDNTETHQPRRCQAAEKDQVTVTFKALHMNTNEDVYYRVRFFNHTRCECV